MIVTIDTGGTKTLITSFDRNGKMGESIKFPTPTTPEEYVTTLAKIVREHYAHQKVDAIVLALPGTVQDGTAIWCYNLHWADFRASELLKDLLPGVPLLVENDANLAGLAESRALNPVPVSSLYITISTGIGSGICTNGFIDPGLRRSEAGQTLLEYDGKIQPWEQFASGHAIVAVYKKLAKDITSKRVWRQIADRISRGFLFLIPTLQPDVIIIGGSVGTHFNKYNEYLEGILKEQLPLHIPCPKIIQAQHPEEAVNYGCYYYAKDFLDNRKARS